MKPFSSTSTPALSRPRSRLFGRRPTATSTRSKTGSLSATSSPFERRLDAARALSSSFVDLRIEIDFVEERSRAACAAAAPGRGRRRAAGRRSARRPSPCCPGRRRRSPFPGRCSRRRRPASCAGTSSSFSAAGRVHDARRLSGRTSGPAASASSRWRRCSSESDSVVPPSTCDGLAVDEPAAADDVIDLARLGTAGRGCSDSVSTTFGQWLRTPLRSIFGARERDAEVGGVAGVGDELGGVQQRLGRNAADVQAGAAGPLARRR